MENYFDVSRRILDLSTVIQEGLEHIIFQLDEMRIEESLILLKDSLEGIYSIEKAVKLIFNELQINSEHFEQILGNLRTEFTGILQAYEKKDLEEIKLILGKKILTDYSKWQRELNNILIPIIQS